MSPISTSTGRIASSKLGGLGPPAAGVGASSLVIFCAPSVVAACCAQKGESEVGDAREESLELGLVAKAALQDGVAVAPLQRHPLEDRRCVVAQLPSYYDLVLTNCHRKQVPPLARGATEVATVTREISVCDARRVLAPPLHGRNERCT